jgi:tRNA-dihydrouridine synthase
MNAKLDQLPKPFFVLAPMDDVTDTVFRRVVKASATPDLFFTEFVNVDGLQSPGRPRLINKLRLSSQEGLVIAQIWGKNPDNFYKTARQIADGTIAREVGAENFNFTGVDLNMGCPQKNEVKAGACSALINDRPLAEAIIDATRDGLDNKMPISVKTRIGFNEVDLTWPEFLLNKKLDMLTIHGRTRKEMSKVPAHWEIIGQVRELRDRIAPDTLIVGNGDVINYEHGKQLAEQYQLDGIMIGRGIFQDPFAFAENSPWENYSKEQKIELYKKHIQLFADTWKKNERPVYVLNKFCKIYINGFDNAKELRDKLMNITDPKELISCLSSSS